MNLEEYRFPMFIDLKGKKAVVIGGGTIAQRRIGTLLSFGADVTIIAPECSCVPENAVYVKRCYRKGDLAGAFIAVAATDDRDVNHSVGCEAAENGIFVSVADRHEESTFFFPAVCAGSGLVAGIVSKGDEHKKTARAAKAVRKLLEDME